MPALLLNTNEDGTVTVAPCDPTPEMLAEGETFASVEEAVSAVGDVLGNPDAEGEEAEPGEGGETATEEVAEPTEASQVGMDPEQMPAKGRGPMAMMREGYAAARGGR